MKEAGFPKPYHLWLFPLDEPNTHTSSVQSPYLQTEVFMSGSQVFFSVATPTKAVLSCFTVPVLQLLVGLCCGDNQRTTWKKKKSGVFFSYFSATILYISVLYTQAHGTVCLVLIFQENRSRKIQGYRCDLAPQEPQEEVQLQKIYIFWSSWILLFVMIQRA